MSGACSTAAYNTGYWSGSEAAQDRIWLAQASAAFRAFRSLHVCLCMLFVCRVFVALSRFTRTSTECIRLRRPLSIPHLRRRNWTPRIQPPPHSHRTLCSAQAATLGSGPPPAVPVSAAPSRPFPRSPSARFSSSLRPRAWSPRSSSMCPRTFLSYGCSVHTPSLVRHPAFVYPRNPAMLVMVHSTSSPPIPASLSTIASSAITAAYTRPPACVLRPGLHPKNTLSCRCSSRYTRANP